MATFKDPNNRPQVDAPNVGEIPSYVKKFDHWILWRFDWTGDSWAKVPYDPKTLDRARSDTPSTWDSFDSTVTIYFSNQKEFDGIGFVFSLQHDDLCGIDFDNCIDVHGEIDAAKSEWINKLDSYTELSVSGTGAHVIVRGASGAGLKRNDIEIYDRGRYFTFTGRSWHNPAKAIRWRQPQIEQLRETLAPPVKPQERRTPIEVTDSVDELLRKAFAAKNGDSIFSLYQGRIDDYANDDSAADLALCSKLAFWSGGNRQVLDEMFRGSKLFRDKWDKRHSSDGRTYGQMTIDKALDQCAEFYTRGAAKVVHSTTEETPLAAPSSGIYRVRDLKDKVFRLYERGRQRGEHPGWDNLAKLYTVKKRQFTVLTGIPGSGKTAVLDAMLINLAFKSKWRTAVCSVENQPIEDHLSVLLEIYAGLPFNDGPSVRMDRTTVEESLDWFDKHFVFVLPDESERTLNGVMSLVDELDVDGVVVDPWNELEHRRPPQMTETEYVSQSLSKMRAYARTHNQHWWLVAHPTKLQKDKNSGKYHVPTLYDISGSAHFRNKADMGVVVWRDAEIPDSPTTIFVQKVRFRWCGEVDKQSCQWNRKKRKQHEGTNLQ
jgi:hypothetical protein